MKKRAAFFTVTSMVLLLTACSTTNNQETPHKSQVTSKKSSNDTKISSKKEKKIKKELKSQEDVDELFANKYWLMTSEKPNHLPLDDYLSSKYLDYTVMYLDDMAARWIVGSSQSGGVDEVVENPEITSDNGYACFVDEGKISILGNVFAIEFNDDESLSLRATRNYNGDGISTYIQKDLAYYPLDIKPERELYFGIQRLDKDTDKLTEEDSQHVIKKEKESSTQLSAINGRDDFPKKNRPAESDIAEFLANLYFVEKNNIDITDKQKNGDFSLEMAHGDSMKFDIHFYSDEVAHIYVAAEKDGHYNRKNGYQSEIIYNYVTGHSQDHDLIPTESNDL